MQELKLEVPVINTVYRAKPVYSLAKRLLECLVALAILIVLSPLWVIVALAIRLTSEGPILFKGRVVGKDGREFTYYKFRSMTANNDNSSHRNFIENYVKSSHNNNYTPIFKLTGDPRITPVGRVLRKFSIDEVPQLLNVLKGEMAIVGPRPPVVYEYQLYDEFAKQRLTVLPGITGLAQIRARNRASFQQMLETDLEYIERRSLGLDLSIMLKTPLVMLKGV